MKKKKPAHHKRRATSHQKKSSSLVLSLFILLLVVLGIVFTYNKLRDANVLGFSTASLLADRGSDNKESSEDQDNEQDRSRSYRESDSKQTNAQVPEKKDTTEDRSPTTTVQPNREVRKQEKGDVRKTEETMRLRTEFRKEVEVEDGNHVEFESDGASFSAKIKKEDGDDITLDEDDALEKLNESLEDDEVEIGTASGRGLTIEKHGIEAQTRFPLSIDPVTRTLFVTTPKGTKAVTILPDQAVENLLENKKITEIASSSGTSTGSTTGVVLSTLNDEPVFEINGFSKKKFLGIFPVSFAKTAFVSADTGDVVKIDQSFLEALLERLSF